MGGGKVRHQHFWGVWRDTAATPAKRYKIQEISCDTCSATGGTCNRVSRERVGVKIVQVLPLCWGQKEHMNKIPRKSQENGGTIPR